MLCTVKKHIRNNRISQVSRIYIIKLFHGPMFVFKNISGKIIFANFILQIFGTKFSILLNAVCGFRLSSNQGQQQVQVNSQKAGQIYTLEPKSYIYSSSFKEPVIN